MAPTTYYHLVKYTHKRLLAKILHTANSRFSSFSQPKRQVLMSPSCHPDCYTYELVRKITYVKPLKTIIEYGWKSMVLFN